MSGPELLPQRDPLAAAMFAAWVNVDPDKVPPEFKQFTCAATMEAWGRVGQAAQEYLLNPAALAAIPTVQAMMAAALAEAAKKLEQRADLLVQDEGSWEPDTNVTNLPEWAEIECEVLEESARLIRALTPADAATAYARALEDAEDRGRMAEREVMQARLAESHRLQEIYQRRISELEARDGIILIRGETP